MANTSIAPLPHMSLEDLEKMYNQDLVIARPFGNHLPTPYVDPVLVEKRIRDKHAKQHLQPNGEPQELHTIYEAEDFFSFDNGADSLDEYDRFALADER